MSSIHLSELIAAVHKHQRSIDDAFNRDVDTRSVELLLSRKSLTKQLKQFGGGLFSWKGLSPDNRKLLEDFAANKTKLSVDGRRVLKEVQSGETSLPDVWVKVRTEDGQLGRLLPVIQTVAEWQLHHERAEQMGLTAYCAATVWEFIVQQLTVRGIPCDEERLSEYAAHVGLGAAKGPDDVVDFIARQHDEGLITEELLAEIWEKFLGECTDMDLPVPSGVEGYSTPLKKPSSELVQYVTLEQISAIINRSKRTLENWKTRENNPLPPPDIEGGGGKPDEWIWSTIRTWLESNTDRQLPEVFPDHRFNRS